MRKEEEEEMMTVLTDVNDVQLHSHVLVSVFKRPEHERIRNQQNKLRISRFAQETHQQQVCVASVCIISCF